MLKCRWIEGNKELITRIGIGAGSALLAVIFMSARGCGTPSPDRKPDVVIDINVNCEGVEEKPVITEGDEP